jgi:hypothetical protein
LAERQRQAERMLDPEGAGHLVHDLTGGTSASRPWRLDPVPMVIEQAEFDLLARAVAQRTRLIEAALADLYGDRMLVRSGTVPAAEVAATPALRMSAGLQRPARWLAQHAVDVVRTADGGWRVVADLTDSPTGLGYALLNRSITARVMAEPLRAAGTAAPAVGWRWPDGSAVGAFGWARGRPAQSELLPAALLLDGIDGPNGRWIDALPEPAAGVSTRSALMLFAVFTDCNGNDRPDALEIAANPALDGDGDGRIDSCGRTDPADINGDGRVDAADLALVLNAWGSKDISADIDGSGRVDAADLAAVLSAWSPAI